MDKWQQEVHRRLLADDCTAPAELVEALLVPLLHRLGAKYSNLCDPDLLSDAVTDALISYIKRPTQFDPSNRSLIGFLYMAAEGDLRNALAKHKRIKEKEISWEGVELEVADGNHGVEEENFETEPEREKLRQALPRLFGDPQDLMVVEMIISGERTTKAFVEVLKLQHLPLGQQRREVKRHKDRLKKRLERYGKATLKEP